MLHNTSEISSFHFVLLLRPLKLKPSHAYMLFGKSRAAVEAVEAMEGLKT